MGAGAWKAAGSRSAGTQTGRGAHTAAKMWDIKDGACRGWVLVRLDKDRQLS